MKTKILFTLIILTNSVMLSYGQTNMSSRQTNLQLTHSKDKIFVFTNPSSSNQLIEYKAHTLINNVTLNEVLTKFSEYEQHTDWVYNCEESELIEDNNDIVYLYQVCNASWPIRNRDYVLRLQKREIDSLTTTIVFKAVDKKLPSKKNLVRVNHFNGYWLLQQIGTQVKVSMYCEFDPMLSMPRGMRKSFATKIPFNTLRNLRQAFE